MRTPARLHLEIFVSLALLGSVGGCAGRTMRSTATAPLTAQQMAQLWMEPADIQLQDLFYGSGGREQAPKPGASFKLVGLDTTGNSAGFDVEDPAGRPWRIKIGIEVQPEIVASRLLWAIGFHQPPLYFVSDWNLDGREGDSRQAARFRLEKDYDSETSWSWHENPFVGTRPFKGLIVANLMLNNWDLKGTNNRIYAVSEALAGDGPRRWFVVQDLGAALGATRWPTGNRNDIDSFERQDLIEGLEDGRVEFDYHARHTELFEDITPADVAWTCRLLARLTDQQWHDAFRAANYPQAIATRFIDKLKAKVQEGLALDARADATP